MASMIEYYYPHLRHGKRGNIEIDDFIREKIISILEGEKL